jgi:hypothetical protein
MARLKGEFDAGRLSGDGLKAEMRRLLEPQGG